MKSKIIELLSEEIRETRNMTLAIRQETEEIRRETCEIRRIADVAEKRADAAWELVIITREESKRPFWRRWLS